MLKFRVCRLRKTVIWVCILILFAYYEKTRCYRFYNALHSKISYTGEITKVTRGELHLKHLNVVTASIILPSLKLVLNSIYFAINTHDFCT